MDFERDDYLPFLGELKDLYEAMDRSYRKAASHYGFICRGCEDNCCRTRFFHHTHVEYLYLMEGFRILPGQKKQEATDRSNIVRRKMVRENRTFGPMCPLNVDNRCILYSHRPMICRLHGIPHELRKPGAAPQYHTGCVAFQSRCKDRPYFRFDRTPVYVKMAELEKRFKTATRTPRGIKMTVADMCLVNHR